MWTKYTHNPTSNQIRLWAEDIAGEYLHGTQKQAFATLDRLPPNIRTAVAAYATLYLSDPDQMYPEAEPGTGSRFARALALKANKR